MLAWWILKIEYLDYEFEYLKGNQNAPWDYLSRFPDDTPLENETEEVNAIKAKYAKKPIIKSRKNTKTVHFH